MYTSPVLSFPARIQRDRETSTAEDSQNWHRCRRTGSPVRGFASPEDDSLGKQLESRNRSSSAPAWVKNGRRLGRERCGAESAEFASLGGHRSAGDSGASTFCVRGW